MLESCAELVEAIAPQAPEPLRMVLLCNADSRVLRDDFRDVATLQVSIITSCT